jgi:hypothetical protein
MTMEISARTASPPPGRATMHGRRFAALLPVFYMTGLRIDDAD